MQIDLLIPSCQLFYSSKKQLKNRNAFHGDVSQFETKKGHQLLQARSWAFAACLLSLSLELVLVIYLQ